MSLASWGSGGEHHPDLATVLPAGGPGSVQRGRQGGARPTVEEFGDRPATLDPADVAAEGERAAAGAHLGVGVEQLDL